MKMVGKIMLAIGSGLGVWVITHLGDAGMMGIGIVLVLVLVGAWLTSKEDA